MPLSLNLTGIVDTQQIDAADVTVPFGQVQTFVNAQETALTNEIANRTAANTALVDGVTAFNQLNTGVVGSPLTIASDTIAITKSRHIIDTQGGAATDDLSTITGGVAGDILFLQITSAARTVVLKHNVSGANGLFNYTLADILLDHPSKIVAYLFDGVTSKWCLATAAQQALLLREYSGSTLTPYAALGVPDRTLINTGYGGPRLDVMPGIMASHHIAVVGRGATVQADLSAAPTVSGTPTAAHQADTTYTNFASGGTAGNPGGWNTTFDLFQRRHDVYMDMLIRMPTTITSCRYFFGLWSVAPGNADDPAGSGIGFRYSQIAGDVGFVAYLDDGTTLGLSSAFNTVVADTTYRLRIRVDGSAGGVAYFSVDNGTEVALTSGMPGAATSLGAGCIVYTNVASARSTQFSRADIRWR